MIDLHSHILPGVDDGSPDWETSLEMLRIAVDDGIATIAATPHNLGWTGPIAPHLAIEALSIDLEYRAQAAGLSIRVVPGMEVHLEPDTPEKALAGTVLTLNRTRWMLVELPFALWPSFAEETFFRLQALGYRLLLAHAERYVAVQSNPDILRPLIEREIAIQINAPSLTGLFGPKAQGAAEQLLEAQMVHVIASDGHTTRSRSPQLSGPRAAAEKLIGAGGATRLVQTNPLAIIEDRPIDFPTPLPFKRKRAKLFNLF